MSNETSVWFSDMQDLRDQFNRTGNHFFDRDTLRFFDSKIGDDLYGGRVFVTSEKDGTSPRRWTVCIAEVLEGGNYSVISLSFQALHSSRKANDIAAQAGKLAVAGFFPDYFEYGQDVALARFFDITEESSPDGWIFDNRDGFWKV